MEDGLGAETLFLRAKVSKPYSASTNGLLTNNDLYKNTRNHLFKNPCYKQSMKQQMLFNLPKLPTSFGGQLIKKGQRKVARPLNCKQPIHLVLRCKSSRLLREQIYVEYYLEKFSMKFAVKIYQKATVSNHIHLLIKVEDRVQYTKFVRALSGALAKSLKLKWELLPYTRLVTWGREFEAVQKYITKNTLEAFALIPYQRRKLRPG